MVRKELMVLVFLLCWGFSLSCAAIGDPLEKGDTIPALALKNLEGEAATLQKPDEKLTLVYFWASWCKPCQQTLPQYMELYRKYKNASFEQGSEGFTIYAISLDSRRKAWQQASKRHRIPSHVSVSDLKGWDSKAVDKFGVGAIPASFLVDAQGVVRAVNMKTKLREYLKTQKR